MRVRYWFHERIVARVELPLRLLFRHSEANMWTFCTHTKPHGLLREVAFELAVRSVVGDARGWVYEWWTR